MICPSLVEKWYDWSHVIIEDHCPACQSDQVKLVDQVNGFYLCEACNSNFTSEESEYSEVVGRTYRTIQYKADQNVEGDNIVILHSPYYTWAPLCSMCYLNAGNLDSAVAMVIDESSGYKTYCFGSSWFEDRVAPYPLYKVSNGALVMPRIRKKQKRNHEGRPQIVFSRPIILDF